jgi:hypothetical protein
MQQQPQQQQQQKKRTRRGLIELMVHAPSSGRCCSAVVSFHLSVHTQVRENKRKERERDCEHNTDKRRRIIENQNNNNITTHTHTHNRNARAAGNLKKTKIIKELKIKSNKEKNLSGHEKGQGRFVSFSIDQSILFHFVIFSNLCVC